MRVVLAPGCFDCFHEGHGRLLAAAKRCGDGSGDAWLIVAVNTDESVKQLKGQVIQNLRTRMSVVAKHPSVDAVIPFAGAQYELLEAVRPDIVVKGGDYTVERVIGHLLVHRYGGQVRIIEKVRGIATESLQNRTACAK